MRARSERADCALVTRAVYDAHPPDPARARGDVPRHGLSLLASSQKKLGLADRGRARSAARKTNQAHGPRTGCAMRRERRAADAPCGRFVFSKHRQRRPGTCRPERREQAASERRLGHRAPRELPSQPCQRPVGPLPPPESVDPSDVLLVRGAAVPKSSALRPAGDFTSKIL